MLHEPRPNPSIERTPSSVLRALPAAAHVKRSASLAHDPRSPMNNPTLQAIAERTFVLTGPDTRNVVARIGAPEPDPSHPTAFRCPFQVTGLSNDDVQYASGVDSFQALNLAFAGIRRAIQTNASVLAAFHKDFSLTWEGQAWELGIPRWVSVHDLCQLEQLEHFLKGGLRSQPPNAEA